jgi:hypothetical protein
MKSGLARAAAAGFLMFELLALTGGPALADPTGSVSDAHEGHGVLVVEARHRTGPTDIHYVVRLTWSGDGHRADAGAVTASVVGPQGPLPPTVLLPYDLDGRYAATLQLPAPGIWTVRFSSTNPGSTIDSLETVPAAPVSPVVPVV